MATPIPPSALASPPPSSSAQPWVRFTTYIDPRAQRPSLAFSPVCRILPTGNEIIRVGRYSDREAQIAPGTSPGLTERVPSAAPVGFKSKVVSRRHCEFWHQGGRWFVRDVKSSSGTFLNHIRLSPPGTESHPFPINDGDIVQLGIDFKGGEEMIFRCVKMRLELNRAWQSRPNTFNLATHRRLRSLANAGSGFTSHDCSICLNSISPCQSLFVAPCSHTWHYKCIRSLLDTAQYPGFQCPNCRAGADLEADVEDVEGWQHLDWDDSDLKDDSPDSAPTETLASPTPTVQPAFSATNGDLAAVVTSSPLAAPTISRSQTPVSAPGVADDSKPAATLTSPSRPDLSQEGARLKVSGTDGPSTPSAPPRAQPMPMRSRDRERTRRTPSPTITPVGGNEGLLTPRNDAGPWVFDGGAGRRR